MTRRHTILLTCWVALCLPVTALAERSDRDKPVHIEASRITIDDVKKIQIFEGDVRLSQGTLSMRANKFVVSQDADGYHQGTAYGSASSPASFRQKRDGRNDFVEGEAERIEHDARAEKTELFNRARIRNGQDEVQGEYIAYDAATENYVVSGSAPEPESASTDNAPPKGRVRAVIQPKSTPPAPTDTIR